MNYENFDNWATNRGLTPKQREQVLLDYAHNGLGKSFIHFLESFAFKKTLCVATVHFVFATDKADVAQDSMDSMLHELDTKGFHVYWGAENSVDMRQVEVPDDFTLDNGVINDFV